MGQDVHADAILKIASGFMASKLLFAASKIGLFEKIGEGGKKLEELADELAVAPRRLRILADAIVALGLLKKEEESYQNTEASLSCLAGFESEGLRPFLSFWDQISYQKWMRLDEALHGKSLFGEFRFTENEQKIFSAGIESITNSVANRLPDTYDFNTHRALLDLGGGTGSYIQTILRRFPHLTITLCELPQVASIARKKLAGLSEKINVLDFDIRNDPIPGDHDVILVANVLHIFSQERIRKILSAIRERTPPEAKLLLVDFWTDTTHTKPLLSALLAAEFLIASGQGEAYSVEEAIGWLNESGWKFDSHRPLSGAFSMIIASRL